MDVYRSLHQQENMHVILEHGHKAIVTPCKTSLSNRAAAATCFHPPPIQYAYAIKVKKICNESLISRGMEKGLREKVIL